MEALIVVAAFLVIWLGYALVRKISPGGAPDTFEHFPDIPHGPTLGDDPGSEDKSKAR